MSQQQVPIEHVKIGMFIEDMDIPWMDSPFLRHKKKIKTDKDIALLRKAGVKILTINVEKSDATYTPNEAKVGSNETAPQPSASIASKGELDPATKKTDAVDDLPEESSAAAEVSFKDQFKAAKKLQGQVSNVLDGIADDIAAGGPVNSEALKPIVKESLSLIDQHNQALLALLHGQRRNKQIQAHSFSVMSLAIGFSDQLGVPEPLKISLATSALLHETGWTRLPLNLFLKGKAYSENEKKLSAQHIPIIAGILKNSPGIDTLIIKTALQHHASFEKESEFSADTEQGIAQILAICNYYDALVHGIGEQTAQLPSNAVRRLLGLGKQGHFHMSLVTAFIKHVGVFPIGSSVILSNGAKAIVTDINRASPMQPHVRIWYDEKGARLSEGAEISLSEANVTVTETFNPLVGNNDPYNLLHLDTE
jgi:HD-GYP domain-containing protein (c-di-GMP phosphodiesterase class II)